MTTYNPNFFSTQPSAGAVPAQQVMMAAQQAPHMLAAGQPMMAAQQPMMMVPAGQQPMMMVPAGKQQPMMVPAGQQQQMYAPMSAPVQKQQGVMQQQQVKPVAQMTPKIKHGAEGSKTFTVVGVQNPHLLEVEAPNLSWQMMKAGTPSGNDYLYSYDPAKQIHNVSVKYAKQHVDGSPFQLVPRDMQNKVQTIQSVKATEDPHAHKKVFVSFNEKDPHHLIARNVPDVDKLDFKTDMGFQLLTDPSDPKAFHLKLKDTGKVHPLDVTYNGEMVPNGQFEFVPKAMKAQHAHQKKKEQVAARVNSAREAYMQSVKEMDALKLDAPAPAEEKTPYQNTNRQVARQLRNVTAEDSNVVAVPQGRHKRDVEAATMNARVPHMTQAANYGPMVMSSQPQQMMPQAQVQQQPMMAQQAMMQPMAYTSGQTGPPMYMVPQQQMMMQQGQPRMYKQ